MGYNELREYLKPIVERRPVAGENRQLLTSIGIEWERRKQWGQVKDIDKENPFKYIKGEFSVYSARGVYSYIWQCLTKQLKMIRLGPNDLKVDERPDSLDKFSKHANGTIPYFLEAIRHDKVLKEHLEISQEGSMLVVKINI